MMNEAFALIIHFIWAVFGTRRIAGKDILIMHTGFTPYGPVYLKNIDSVG